MILIFGGAYQGKLEYAFKRFNFSNEDVYKCNYKDITVPSNKKIIYEIDKWILSLIEKDENALEIVQNFIDNNKDSIIVCNDISCGVVPIDPIMREWRETVGRILAEIANQSDEVIRLFCGIPTRIR